jgi:hypothetical protein
MRVISVIEDEPVESLQVEREVIEKILKSAYIVVDFSLTT